MNNPVFFTDPQLNNRKENIMIIAKIGNSKFQLESLNHAHSLLEIIERAVPIEEIYDVVGPRRLCQLSASSYGHELSIEVIQGQPITPAEAAEARAEYAARQLVNQSGQ